MQNDCIQNASVVGDRYVDLIYFIQSIIPGYQNLIPVPNLLELIISTPYIRPHAVFLYKTSAEKLPQLDKWVNAGIVLRGQLLARAQAAGAHDLPALGAVRAG